MTTASKRRSLATLAILASVGLVTGGAFFAVTYTQWNWLSVLLGCVAIAVLVACLELLISTLESWLDRAYDAADDAERGS